jgi:hypothetical protein
VASPRKHLPLAIGLILLAALNFSLYGPLFSPEESPYRGSIAQGYAGITRFIAEHPNPWGWNPQQYAGLPTQFTYPPLLPYTASAIHWLTGLDPFPSYRFLISALACLGPVTLAFAFWYFTGSTWLSLLLGVAYSICSPVYGLFTQIDSDRGLYYLPWRILVLMKYGEGPHVGGMTFLPLILVALRWGLSRRDFFSLFVMATALAIAPLTNWLLAFALTITVLILLLSGQPGFFRLLQAALLGWSLSAFWLTPSYITTTLFNWPQDAYGYRVEQSHWLIYLGLVFTVGLAAWLFRRYQAPWCLRFSSLAMLSFLWIAGGFYLYNFDTIPESRRYILEFEFFLFLALFAWIQAALNSRVAIDRVSLSLVLLFLLAQSSTQLSQSFTRKWSDWGLRGAAQTLEYHLTRWLQSQQPHGRVFVSGGLRFRLNASAPLHQVGGTFESGLRNRLAVNYFYQIRTDAGSQPGQQAQDTLHQLTAIGAEYAVVHDPQSEEFYRDIKSPAKFHSLGPVVFAPTPHDRVYRLPFRSLAHLVRPAEFPRDIYKNTLPPFYAALADTSRPTLAVSEIHPGHWRISGPIPDGHEVAFSMNWDPGWRATQDGQPLTPRSSALGLIALPARPSPHSTIDLVFTPSNEQIAFAALSVLVWVASIGLCIRSRSWQASTSTPS